jgi:hypothetical protein
MHVDRLRRPFRAVHPWTPTQALRAWLMSGLASRQRVDEQLKTANQPLRFLLLKNLRLL